MFIFIFYIYPQGVLSLLLGTEVNMTPYRVYRRACLEEERIFSKLALDRSLSRQERMKLMREYSLVFKTKILKR